MFTLYEELDVSLGPVRIDQAWMERFSLPLMEDGNAEQSLHLNEPLAKGKGLESTVLEGRMAVSLISRLLTHTFGSSWTGAGELDVRFRTMMFRNSVLTARARYARLERRHDRDVITLEVWVDSDRAERTVVGTAWVPESG